MIEVLAVLPRPLPFRLLKQGKILTQASNVVCWGGGGARYV